MCQVEVHCVLSAATWVSVTSGGCDDWIQGNVLRLLPCLPRRAIARSLGCLPPPGPLTLTF
eukprot:9748631-Lingulodinium_polyedra.AAC.1